jgi:TrmH RNA methyltransferase
MTKRLKTQQRSFSSRNARPAGVLPKIDGSSREASEMSYYGRHACRAVFHHRPDAIIRVYLTNELIGDLSPLMKFCAEKKLAYHVVSSADLEKITGSVHHEGVCILARRNAALNQASILAQMSRADQACYLYLDGVGNPHNIGALLHTQDR